MPSPRNCRVITSLNRKGGVGKTHLCWLIASVCQERRKRCLVLDLDPQANFTSSFLPDDGRPGVEALFDPAVEPAIRTLIRRTEYDCIDLAPSSPRLEPFNATDPRAWAKGGLHLSLAEAVAAVRGEYDYILCDCPPSLSLVSYAALCASDFVMIPMEAARWGALGTQHVVQAMQEVRARHNPGLQLLGYVASRYKRRRSYQETYLAELRKHFGEDAFETVIPDLAAFEKAVTDRIPLTLHSPRSYASTVARQFFDEVESRREILAPRGQPDRGRGVRRTANSAA